MNKIIFGAPLILVILLVPNLALAGHHHNSGNTSSGCCLYPSNGDNPKADTAFEKGLDAGTLMAQNGDAAPDYNDCIGDGGNQADYGQYVNDFCNGTIQGYEAFGK